MNMFVPVLLTVAALFLEPRKDADGRVPEAMDAGRAAKDICVGWR